MNPRNSTKSKHDKLKDPHGDTFQSNCWKAKNKGRNLKTAREKQPVTRKLSSVTLISDFWPETRTARRKGGNVFAGLKECRQPRVLYPTKPSSKRKRDEDNLPTPTDQKPPKQQAKNLSKLREFK